jgi:hypothetical protein
VPGAPRLGRNKKGVEGIMINYISEYVTRALVDEVLPGSTPYVVVDEVSRELERLDPRDFEPGVQAEFLRLRGQIRHFATHKHDSSGTVRVLKALLPVLALYRGDGSWGKARSFSFVLDPDLRQIVQRDYVELKLRLFPSGAWKSTVVMAGSILEAILYDRLSSPTRLGLAMGSSKAPRKKNGTTKDITKDTSGDKWTLEDLIEVASDVRLLPTDQARTFDQVLRDYRNFIHPKKEIKARHSCTEAKAMMSVGALDDLCNYFEQYP